MDGQIYKVVFPNGKQGCGHTVPEATRAALGRKEHLAFLSKGPQSGYYHSGYVTRTLVPKQIGARTSRTAVDRNMMYEVCYVYIPRPDGRYEGITPVFTIYRANRMDTLAQLPANQPTQLALVAKLPNKTKR